MRQNEIAEVLKIRTRTFAFLCESKIHTSEEGDLARDDASLTVAQQLANLTRFPSISPGEIRAASMYIFQTNVCDRGFENRKSCKQDVDKKPV